MKLIWHIFQKDFRHLRLLLLLWTVLLLVRIYVCAGLFSDDCLNMEWYVRQGAFLALLAFLDGAICYVLVAALVLEDPLVGTRMFWATRPISGVRLLAAKLLGIILLVIGWPALVSLPWWLWSGFAGADLIHATGQTMLLHAAIGLSALVLSALTGQNSRFLLWSLVMLVAPPVCAMILASQQPRNINIWPELVATRVFLISALGVIGSAVVVVLQYRTRRLVRSIVITVSGVVLGILIAALWPEDLTRFWPKDQTLATGTEPITITFGEAKVEVRNNRAWIDLACHAKGLPDDLVLYSGQAETEFRWSDGETLKSSSHVGVGHSPISANYLLNLPSANPDPASEKKRQEMADEMSRKVHGTGFQMGDKGVWVNVNCPIPEEKVAKFRAESPSCTIALRLETGRPVLLGELPLREGAECAANGIRARMVKVAGPEVAKPEVGKLESARLGETYTKELVTIVVSQPSNTPVLSFHLVDRAHGTAVMSGMGGTGLPIPTALPVQFNRANVHVGIPKLWREEEWIDALASGADDTVAIVSYKPNGGFNRAIHTDRLDIKFGKVP